jgi:NAD(P)-dependent dehydrogenase (short-subunit alcohol dehydrogenase family)
MTLSQKYGPWAVIAGGSEGIGAAFASELAARGVNLFWIADDILNQIQSVASLLPAERATKAAQMAAQLKEKARDFLGAKPRTRISG